jgi:hypothetical protein
MDPGDVTVVAAATEKPAQAGFFFAFQRCRTPVRQAGISAGLSSLAG